MTRVYKQVTLEDALQLRVPDADEWTNDWDDPYYTNVLYEELDGTPIALVAVDGGEPEDQTLSRSFAWVVGALNDAYNKGWKDSKEHYAG